MSEEQKQVFEMIKKCIDIKGTLKLNSICCNDILNYIEQLQQENKKLKDNWNKLIEYLNEEIKYSTKMDFKTRQTSAIYFLQEMEKLEGDKYIWR